MIHLFLLKKCKNKVKYKPTLYLESRTETQYKTLNNNKFTIVKVKTFINESTKKEKKTLITESNNTENDNLNDLPTYK